jgi:hypothetical protein
MKRHGLGTWIASSDQMARLWEISSGNAIRLYTGHRHAVVAVALNDSSVEVPPSDDDQCTI